MTPLHFLLQPHSTQEGGGVGLDLVVPLFAETSPKFRILLVVTGLASLNPKAKDFDTAFLQISDVLLKDC